VLAPNAKLLKRVFEIDIVHCPNCGGELKIIAAILRGKPGLCTLAAGDREDPHPPGSSSASTASSAGPMPGASSGLTLPNRDRSDDPATRAAGVGWVQGLRDRWKRAGDQG
jgi:hypothetical protein